MVKSATGFSCTDLGTLLWGRAARCMIQYTRADPARGERASMIRVGLAMLGHPFKVLALCWLPTATTGQWHDIAGALSELACPPDARAWLRSA